MQTHVVGDQFLVIHDHNIPVNAVGCDFKAQSKHAYVLDAPVAYEVPKTGQAFILSIKQATEMKGSDHLLHVHVIINEWCCDQ